MGIATWLLTIARATLVALILFVLTGIWGMTANATMITTIACPAPAAASTANPKDQIVAEGNI